MRLVWESQSLRYGEAAGWEAAIGQERTDTAGFVYPRYWSCYMDIAQQDVLHIKALQAHTFDRISIHIQTPKSD